MNQAIGQLVLVVAATYKGAVGFGDVFTCEVKRVVSGDLKDTAITLIVLPADKDTLNFVASHQAPAEIEVGFKFARQSEPYSTAQITGFVDAARSSWVVEFVREAAPPK